MITPKDPNKGGRCTFAASGNSEIQPSAEAQFDAEKTQSVLNQITAVPTPNNTGEGAALPYSDGLDIIRQEHNEQPEEMPQTASVDAWSERNVIDTPTLDGLTPLAKSVIETYVAERQVPNDFVIAPIIAAIGAAAGNKVKVSAYGYTNNLNTAVAVIAPSGSNKSTPGREIMRPLLDIDERLRKESEEEIKQYEEQKAAAAKSKTSFNVAQPKERCIVLQNTTEEGRKKALADNPHGVIQYNDELASFFDNQGKYTKSNETGEIISILDGDSISDTRKTGCGIYAKRVCFSVFGTIQPMIALKRLATENSYYSGLTPRFLLFQPTNIDFSNMGSGNVEESLRFWSEWVNRIYNLSGEWVLTPCEGALKIHSKFWEESTNILQHPKSDALQSVVSKLRIAIWKLAGIAHLINEASNMKNTISTQITADEMNWAASICKYVYRKHMELLAQTDMSTEIRPADVVSMILRLNPNANQNDIAQLLGISHSNVRVIKHRLSTKKGV